MRYRAFRTKTNNQFHFQFTTDGDDTVLKSQAYADKNACFNGIRSVMENASNPDRYSKLTENGKHLFIIKAGNNQEIARSVPYDTEKEADDMIGLCRTQIPNATSKAAGADKKAKPTAAAAPPSTAASKTNNNDDDYKPLAFYESRIAGTEDGFDSFADEGESYFTYNLSKAVVLISEGYSSDSSRDNGIASVTKNMPEPKRYVRGVHKNGKHFFSLRAGNNQEIATSRWFDSEEEMNAYIAVLQSGGKGAPKPKATKSSSKSAAKASGPIYKEYKPLGFYEERIEGTEFGYDSFADSDKHYFTVNHEAKPVLISEDYTSDAGRDKGIASVKKNVKNEARYVPMVHPNGMHYFNLLAGNKQEIATSRWFETKKEMNRAMAWLQGTGGTRRRKKAVREKKPAAERRYISQGLSYPCSEIKYDTFQSGGNERFYFVFKSKEDKAVLINGDVRGFATQEDLDKGLEQVAALAPHSKNYDRRTTKNGKHYFYVVNEEGKSIGRGSLFYAEEADMESAIKLLACGIGAVKAAPAAPAKVDDYMTCEAYAGKTGGFNSFADEASGEHYFSFNDNSGQVLLRSEGYTTTAARDNGIESVKKNYPEEKRWVSGTVLDGKQHYYALRAGNNQEIARSCYYSNEEDMNRAWALTKYDLGAGEREKAAAAAAALAAAAATKAAAEKAEADRLAAEKAAAEKAAAAAKAEADRLAAAKAEADRLAAEKAEADRLAAEKAAAEKAEADRLAAEKAAAEKAEAERLALAKVESDRLEAEKAAALALAAKAAAAPKKEAIQDDYLPCEAYKGAEGFYKFKNEDNGEFYFAYNDKDGKTLLRSEGYTSASGRDNGIESVKKNAPIEGRWKKETAMNGKYHYYVLRAGNNQEIARSCYQTESEKMNTNFMLLGAAFAPVAAVAAIPEVPKVVKATPPPPPPKPKERKDDDYLPCKEYHGHTVTDKQNNVAFFKHKNGQLYFVVYKKDGSVKLRSEGFTDAKERDDELSGVLKNMNNKDMYSQIKRGDYTIHVLKDKTGREVGRSCAEKKKKAVIPPVVPPPPPPKKKKKVVAAAPIVAAAAAAATVGAVHKEEEKKKKGCMAWWLPILLGLLLLAALLYFMKGCEGCAKKPVTPIIPPVVDTTPPPPPPVKTAICPGAGDFKLKEGSAGAIISDYLSDPESTYPKRFTFDDVGFGRNGARLSSSAKKALDDLIVCMKGCDEISVDVYGYLGENEKSSYRGSKEVSLDDVRAKKVYDYLKSRGINESRINYEGDGTGDSNNAIIQINN